LATHPTQYAGGCRDHGGAPDVGALEVDATVAWVAMRSPPSNTVARFENAERRRNESMIKNNKVFFSPWETIHEGNPQEIIERGEKATQVPLLIMQGALDDNVLPAMQEKFVEAYRVAGGTCDYRLFENSTHEWVAEPGPQTDKARTTVKEFIARQLRA
jgi:alpha-beta hydrolase superfamily lysophospholipase